MSNDRWTHLKEEFSRRYFSNQYESLQHLAEEVGVPWPTANHWLYKPNGGNPPLKLQKEDLENSIRAEAVNRAVNELAASLKKAGTIMDDILTTIQVKMAENAYSDKELIDIFAKIGGSLKSIHSTIRLEEGKSTANVASQSGIIDDKTLKDALNLIRADPFINISETIEELDVQEKRDE